jgi:hypothetical protein
VQDPTFNIPSTVDSAVPCPMARNISCDINSGVERQATPDAERPTLDAAPKVMKPVTASIWRVE